jgi:hypothetical protein
MTQKRINVPRDFETLGRNVIKRNLDLFAKKDSDLGLSNIVNRSIDTGDNNPIKNRPLSSFLKEKTDYRQGLQWNATCDYH